MSVLEYDLGESIYMESDNPMSEGTEDHHLVLGIEYC